MMDAHEAKSAVAALERPRESDTREERRRKHVELTLGYGDAKAAFAEYLASEYLPECSKQEQDDFFYDAWEHSWEEGFAAVEAEYAYYATLRAPRLSAAGK